MELIDRNWLQKVCEAHNKYERSIPLNSKAMRCTQSIFIDRYFKWLEHKCFKLEILGEIHYALFLGHTFTTTQFSGNKKEVSKNYGVTKYLGYNSSEFEISFVNEKGNPETIKLHYNDILDIKYEEITVKQYSDILKLFT